MDLGRVSKELKDIERDKESGVRVEVIGDSIRHLTGYVQGPRDTAYQGGLFKIDIILEVQYPFVPPKMRFVTKVWHPNISSANGAICLDVLKDQWSPALTLKTALLSLQALLSSPQPDDPQDGVVAKQYITDQAGFQEQAKQWTQKYADPSHASKEDAKVQKLMDMGFGKAVVIQALQDAHGDENAALELILTSF